jgi:hypothetical protein
MSAERIPLRRSIFSLTLAAFLILALTMSVAAQDPDDGEPARPAPGSAAVEEEERASEPTPAPQLASPAANGETATAPDKITRVEEIELLPEPATPNLTEYFKFFSANVFVPYDDDMTYGYGGAGCVYRTGGTSFTEHTLQLPQGAEIDYLRIYYYDMDAVNNARAILFTFDGYGGFTEIVAVESDGTPGQSSTASDFFSYFVDNINETLSLRLNYQSGSDSNLKICGVRIRYQYWLPTLTFLPLVLNQTSP